MPTAFVDDLLAVVITPLPETQALFSEYGTLTRLYTTLSASEMTRDPVFDFNPDLPQVSNLRTAAARWECEVDDPDSVALEQFLLVVTLKDGREIRSRPFEDLGEPRPLPLGVQAAAVIEQMDTAGEPVPIRRLTAVTQNVEGALPASYDLEVAYPNPFNAAVLLPFRVPQGLTTADLTLRVYNLLGQPVRTLAQGKQPPGRHLARWDGRDERGMAVSGGVYFVRLETSGVAISRKLLYLQ